MPLPTTGALSLDDIQQEYKQAASGTEVALNDYRAYYDTSKIFVFLSLTNGKLAIGSFTADQDVYYPFNRIEIVIRADSTLTGIPVRISSSDENGNADLISSTNGVTNNNADTGNTMIAVDGTNSYFDSLTSAGPSTNSFYVKTDTASHGSFKFRFYPDVPSGNLVYRHSPSCVINIPTNILGGSELTLANNGNYFAIDSNTSFASMLKNGRSWSFQMTCDPIPSLYSGGSYLAVYIGPFYLATATGAAPYTYSFGTAFNMAWRQTGSYVGGGGLANNANNVAQVIAANTGQATLGGAVTGITLSWTRSNSLLTGTITNNSGSDYLVGKYTGGGTNRFMPCTVAYTDANTANTFTNSSTTWGDPHVRQAYGSSLSFQVQLTYTDQGSQQTQYVRTVNCPHGATFGTVRTTIKEALKEVYYTGDPRSINPPQADYPIFDFEDVAGGLKVTRVGGRGTLTGTITFIDTSLATVQLSNDVTTGAANTGITYTAAGSLQADVTNNNVERSLLNMSVEDYRGGAIDV